MVDYTFLREMAGSFGTVFLVLSFLGVVLFAFRPGSARAQSDAARLPFLHEDRPRPETLPEETRP